MEHERKPRPGSIMGDDERATVGAARRRTPRAGVPVEIPDEVTGNYQGEELRTWRGRRPTPERLQRIEDKQDRFEENHAELAKVVSATREDVSAMRGEMKTLPRLVDLIEKMASGAHVALTAQVKVDAAEKLDEIDERKQRRKRWTNVIGGLFSAGVLGALAHYLAGRL